MGPGVTPKKEWSGGIGTLSERTLHAELKKRLEPDESLHEQPVGSSVADILYPDGRIIEIQTRGFSALKKKLPPLLESHDITVVWPAPREKYLSWIDPESGEVTSRRKSPKRGTPYEVFGELRWIADLTAHPRLTFRIIMVDVEEYRMLDGWSHDHKRGSHRAERIPTAYGEEYLAGGEHGWAALIPPGLAEEFTVKEYAAAAHILKSHAQHAIYVLRHAGAVEACGMRGREKVYCALHNKL